MPTVSPLLDTRRATSAGDYPVRIQLYHNRKQFLIATQLRATQTVYNRFKDNRCNTADSRALRDAINKELTKCNDVLDQLKSFSIDGFRKLYNSTSGIRRKSTSTNLKSLYDDKIERLKADMKFNTASNYRCSLNNILAYAKNELHQSPDDIVLEDITMEWLKAYERWNLDSGNNNVALPNSKNTQRKLKYGHPINDKREGNSIGTVRCYIRPLRTIFNDAIAERLISPHVYPFGKRLYGVGGSSATKEVLTQKQLALLRDYDGDYWEGRLFWFFLYYGNGMNCMDALHLRKSDIRKIDGEEYIRFTRKKTEFSKKESSQVEVHVKPDMRHAMEHYTVKGNPYIFNVLREGMNAEQKHIAVCTFKKTMNVHLSKIGKELGFHINLKMSRSTFATELRNAGVPVAFISRMMAHTSLSTTEIYLASLPSDKLIDITDNLNNYKGGGKKEIKRLKKMRKAIDEAVLHNQNELKSKLKAVI